MNQSLTVMRPFGIDVKVHWTWLVLAFLVMSSLATGWFPLLAPDLEPVAYWIAGFLGSIGLFLSIVFHELAHALVGRFFKMPMEKITLFLFGGVAQMDDEPPSPRAEFFMAAAGPALSLVLVAAFSLALQLATLQEGSLLLLALLSYLASINLVVAAFNLLPGFPLDGGRILRSALWAWRKDLVWATRIASYIGQGFGFVLLVLGVSALFGSQGMSGVWGIVLGFLLMGFARASYVQLLVKESLHGKPAANFMNRKPTVIAPETSISELMQSHLAEPRSEQHTVYPVAGESGELIGCVDVASVQHIPVAEWGQHRVREVVKPCAESVRISPDMDAQDAFQRMTHTGARELIVMSGGRLLGVLTRTALLNYLALNEKSSRPV